MVSKSTCRELLPAMDAVMPGPSCLTGFAKKKVAMEMHKKLLQQHSKKEVHPRIDVPTNVSHRRRVTENRSSCSFERQPARYCVVVLQDFKPRTEDEVNVKRGEQVKLLFMEGEWAYVCRKVSATKKRLSRTSSCASSSAVVFGYIPQSHCRPLTDAEQEQKQSRRRRAASLSENHRLRELQLKLPAFAPVEADEDNVSLPSPTQSTYENPYLNMEILPSDDEPNEEHQIEEDAGPEEGEQIEERCYSFRTCQTTTIVTTHHNRQKGADSSNSSSSCHSDRCSSTYGLGTLITYPGLTSPEHVSATDENVCAEDSVSQNDTTKQQPVAAAFGHSRGSSTAMPTVSVEQPSAYDGASFESTESQITFPYPAVAMFDFSADEADNDDKPAVFRHISIHKAQRLTVFDFSPCGGGDWVLARTDDGRIGTLPFCFAKTCQPFEGYPYLEPTAAEFGDDIMTRPGTDMRRFSSQQRFYCDAASLNSDLSSSFFPDFGREAPDGQSVDLQRFHSINSNSFSRQSSVNASKVVSGHSLGLYKQPASSVACLLSRRSSSPPPPPPALPASNPVPALGRSEHMEIPADEDQDGDEFPAPPPEVLMQQVQTTPNTLAVVPDHDQDDIPVISPHDPSIPEVISLLSVPRRHQGKTSPQPIQASNGILGAASGSRLQTGWLPQQQHLQQHGMRSSSSANLTDYRSSMDHVHSLRAHSLTKGVSELNLTTSSKSHLINHGMFNESSSAPADHSSSQTTTATHDRGHHTGPARGNKGGGKMRSHFSALPHSQSSIVLNDYPSMSRDIVQNQDRCHYQQQHKELAKHIQSSASISDSQFQHATNQVRQQRAPMSSPCKTKRPPFMLSTHDIAGMPQSRMHDVTATQHSQTLPNRSRSHRTRRPGRIHSQDSAIGGSSSDDIDNLSAAKVASNASSGTFTVNTQLTVTRTFRSRGDSQLSVKAGDVVVVADDRDHKDWIWVFAPQQRKFGFVPSVFIRARAHE